MHCARHKIQDMLQEHFCIIFRNLQPSAVRRQLDRERNEQRGGRAVVQLPPELHATRPDKRRVSSGPQLVRAAPTVPG